MSELWTERLQKEMSISVKTTPSGRVDKARFENYLAIMHNLTRKKTELEVICSKLGSPQGVKLTDMPKNPNRKNDKIAYLVQEKMEIESDIKALEKYREDERSELMAAIQELENPKNSKKLYRERKLLVAEASVLRLRYFCMFQWSEINEAFHSGEPDFEIKREDFQRKIFRYHGNAFTDLRKITQSGK